MRSPPLAPTLLQCPEAQPVCVSSVTEGAEPICQVCFSNTNSPGVGFGEGKDEYLWNRSSALPFLSVQAICKRMGLILVLWHAISSHPTLVTAPVLRRCSASGAAQGLVPCATCGASSTHAPPGDHQRHHAPPTLWGQAGPRRKYLLLYSPVLRPPGTAVREQRIMPGSEWTVFVLQLWCLHVPCGECDVQPLWGWQGGVDWVRGLIDGNEIACDHGTKESCQKIGRLSLAVHCCVQCSGGQPVCKSQASGAPICQVYTAGQQGQQQAVGLCLKMLC